VCIAFTPTPTAAAGEPGPTAPAEAPAAFVPGNYQWGLAASGFTQPLLVTHAGDGSGRLFVVEQTGVIRIVTGGSALLQPFLDVSTLVSGSFEQGLLGLAFHPDFPDTPYFYINYTDLRGDTQVVRYTLSADPNVAAPESATTILSVGQPYGNHNGGHLAFGPDGYLYIGLGDGGSAGDPHGNGQSLGVLLGKMLRLDVDGGEPYGIPADNPFAADGGRPEIWAYGLRNPWRFSFDRATGDLYIGDVGQGAYEEIDFQPASSAGGENYGWNFLEGSHEFQGGPPPGDTVLPVAEYAQSQGGCSVTGGYVYRGSALPEVAGVYFYGDYCSGFVWTLARDASGAWQNNQAYSSGLNISSFGEDEAGELYVVDHNGAIYRLARQD
jgi:glucose/arabinose dehydrogenase